MKVLFAVSTEDIAEKIIKVYQKEYKEIISSKNVYYFNAIIKELQRNQTYDRIVISEDLEPFTNNNYETIDKFIFEKLDGISDEAIDRDGRDIPIVVICSERREKGDNLLVKLFSIGVYDALVGNDRTIEKVCGLLNKPRTKKEAKTYYRIEQGEYERENEKNVSELEIQNILAHYRRLGKNEARYVESFNSIAEQYNDEQLKIIIKFLPMEVKAVLESESPKYQSIMTYSADTTKKQEVKKNNLSVSRITDSHSNKLSGPVIIPEAMRKGNEVRKISSSIPQSIESETIVNDTNAILEEIESIEGVAPIEPIEEITPMRTQTQGETETSINDLIQPRVTRSVKSNIDDIVQPRITRPVESDIDNLVQPKVTRPVNDKIENPMQNILEENQVETQIEQPVKRGRGRPKKIVAETEEKINTPKRGRGRPRKNPIAEAPDIEQEQKNIVQGFEENNEIPQRPIFEEYNEVQQEPIFEEKATSGILPGFEEEDIVSPKFKEEEVTPLSNFGKYEEPVLPTVEEIIESIPKFNEDTISKLPGFEDEEQTPKFSKYNNEEETLPKVNARIPNNINVNQNNSFLNNNTYEKTDYNLSTDSDLKEIEDEQSQVDISYLLTQDKKIVSFVGTSKNGVSFLVNNIAEILSNNGIKTAIVDLTKNKNSYYIYTENKEELREIAYASMENLKRGNPIGIEVNKNLTVYTSSPNIRNTGYSIESMLTTLVKNYSLILLDCDYSTNKEYFRVAQEIYMIQSMDVLTIQPLTEFLRRLKLNNILQPEKLRAVINKAQRLRGLNEEMIVGGMSTYNDPEMSIQDRLFDMKTISKTVIPFDIDAYSIYLSGIANCEISTRGYNKVFMNCLNRLAEQVYPVISGGTLKRKNKDNGYMNYEQNGTRFSNNMSSTLDQMKKQYK